MKSIIEKLERAKAGDESLSREIADIVGTAVKRRTFNGGMDADEWDWFPPYTSSIDAALSLVMDGWSWSVAVSENKLHPVVMLGRSYPTNAQVAQEAATPALAICIAALKSRSSL